MDKPVPVVLFAYSRPDHLREVLDSLRANEIPRLYAFSDGPRHSQIASEVGEVRQILRAVDWCNFTLYESEENLGLGCSILRGVSRILSRHESVIVFEDDLICVPGCYRYLTTALTHYRDDPQVMSVTGWTHPRILPPGVSTYPYFDGKAECWTWGTWRRAWEGMEQDAMTLMRRCIARGIDVERYGTDLPKMAAEELKKNLWAVRWMYLHMLQEGLCLRPPHSMVEHLGFDSRATTSAGAGAWANPPLQRCPVIPSRWPEPFENTTCRKMWRVAVGDEPTA